MLVLGAVARMTTAGDVVECFCVSHGCDCAKIAATALIARSWRTFTSQADRSSNGRELVCPMCQFASWRDLRRRGDIVIGDIVSGHCGNEEVTPLVGSALRHSVESIVLDTDSRLDIALCE